VDSMDNLALRLLVSCAWLRPLAPGHTALVDFFQQRVIFSLWPRSRRRRRTERDGRRSKGKALLLALSLGLHLVGFCRLPPYFLLSRASWCGEEQPCSEMRQGPSHGPVAFRSHQFFNSWLLRLPTPEGDRASHDPGPSGGGGKRKGYCCLPEHCSPASAAVLTPSYLFENGRAFI
jgi:hypothetical protein